MRGCENLDGICWVVAIVIVVVLVCLGCSEYGKINKNMSARRTLPSKSARNMVVSQNDSPSESLTERITKGVSVDNAFAGMEVDDSLARIVKTDLAGDIGTESFLQEFHDDESTSFRPINKEQAMRNANVRPAQQMKNGRADGMPPARTIGLSPMAFARKDIQRPVGGSGCMSFNDTDARHVLINEATNCFETGTCPWDKS